MLRALSEAGLRPDLIVGASAGALNGAIVARDLAQSTAVLDAVWDDLDRQSLIHASLMGRAINLTRRGRMFSDGGLQTLFDTYLDDTDTGCLDVPFAAVATDLEAGVAVTISRGPLRTALLASSAIPGVFPLVEIDGRRLCDGGVVANVPVRQAIDLAAASIVVLDCGPDPYPLPSKPALKDLLGASMVVSMRRQVEADLEFARQRVPVLRLPGQPERRIGTFDFSQTDSLVRHAYESAREHLDQTWLSAQTLSA